MQKALILSLLLFFTTILKSQDYISLKVNDYLNNNWSSAYNTKWLKKHFFSTITFTTGGYGDYYSIPSKKINGVISTTMDNGKDAVIDSIFIDEGKLYSIISVSYEPRINLFQNRQNFSISYNMPLIFNLSVIPSEPYNKSTGLFNINVPFMINFNLLYHSTYNNIDNSGISLGFGYQYIFGPLIGGDKIDGNTKGRNSGTKDPKFKYIKEYNDSQFNYLNYKTRRVFKSFLIKIDYKFESFDGKVGQLIGISYGFHEGEYFRLCYGLILGY